MQPKPLFVLWNTGVTEIDQPALEKLAQQHDAMQPYYARAIIELGKMLEQGRLKGRQPDDLIIALRD